MNPPVVCIGHPEIQNVRLIDSTLQDRFCRVQILFPHVLRGRVPPVPTHSCCCGSSISFRAHVLAEKRVFPGALMNES